MGGGSDRAASFGDYRVIEVPPGSPPWAIELVRRINTEFTNKLKLPQGGTAYSILDLPSPTLFARKTIPLTDGAGGIPTATSDGTKWVYPDGTAV